MSMKASTTIRAGTALALAGFVWANGAMAQDSKLVNVDRPADDAASCNALSWHEEFVTSYPWASEACRAVVTVNGKKWARFEGEFQGINDNGSFDAEFTSRSDRELGSVTLMPAPGQSVRLDNKDVSFSDLDRGQILSFYVPEGAIGFAVEPGVPDSQFVKVVERSEAERLAAERSAADRAAAEKAAADRADAERFAAADEAAEAERLELAQADTDRDELDSELPNTAGPLPLIALGGLMSLFGGLGLTIRSKLSKRNS